MNVKEDYMMLGQITIEQMLNPDTWSGRTCREHSAQTKERISEPCLKKQPKLQTKMPMFLDLRAENGVRAGAYWETDGLSLGAYMTHNIIECHKEENAYVYSLISTETQQEEYCLNCSEKPLNPIVSKLSWILEKNPNPKYNLSAKACQGILRRAEKRGKELPKILKDALERQANVSTDGIYSQNISSPKMEEQSPCTVESADTVVENPTFCKTEQSAFRNEQESQGGGKGILIQDEHTGALSTLNNQSVCYGISSYDSNAMKSGNPNSGIYEADTSRTLDLNGGNPSCNQGGMAVVCLEGNGQRDSHKGDGYKESDTMYTLNTVEQHAVCIENHPADSRVKIAEDGVCQTLSGRMETGGGNVPMVMESQTFSDVASCRSAADGTKGVHSQMMKNPEENFVLESISIGNGQVHDAISVEVSKTLNCMDDPAKICLSIATKQISQNIGEDVGMTLCGNDYKEPQCVAYGLDRAAYNQGENAKFSFSVDEEKVETCVAKGPNAVCKAVDCRNATENEMNGSLQAKASNNLNSNNVCRVNSVVRRLTPMECERLQGFPDNWTNIGDWVDSKGKMHKGESDAPRYKALGNSIALPFWQWMAGRMMPYLGDKPTMASLFSGIGGFELVFSRAGCKPVWASEVENFAIAVTKKRFPEE